MANFSPNTPDAQAHPVADLTRILRIIDSLRNMTAARGCTVSEAEIAARKIGEAIQQHSLIVRPPVTLSYPSEYYVTFYDVEVIRETGKALHVRVDGKETWIPRSQLGEGNTITRKGDRGTLTVTRWLAERKGLATGRRAC